MNRLEELLLLWQDRSINAEELDELKRLLATPEGRATAAREFLLTGVVLESLRVQRAAEELAAPPTSPISPQTLPTGRRTLVAVLAGLAACLLVTLVLWFRRDPPIEPADGPAFAQVEQMQGEIFLVGRQKVQPAGRGQVIAPGEGIATEGTESEAVVNMADAVRLTLGGDTTVYTTAAPGQPLETNLLLEKGDLRIEVNRSLRRRKTTVQTPLGSVVAEQEETSLHLSEAAGVVVVHGEVTFRHRDSGKSIRLRTGEYLAIDAAGELYAGRVFPVKGRVWTTFPRTGLNTVSPGFALAFSPRAGQLAVVQRHGEGGGRLGPVHGQDRPEDNTFKGERAVLFSPDGRRLVTTDQANVLVYDTEDRSQVRVLPGKDRRARVQCLAISPDGKSLAVGRAAIRDTAELEVWDLETGTVRETHREHLGTILSVTFSPDGRRLASGGMDRTVRLWDTQTGKELRQIVTSPSQVVWSLAFDPSGKDLAIAVGPPDFRILGAGEVQVWSHREDRVRTRLVGHGRAVTSVVYAEDGQTLITGSSDTTVRFWDAANGRQVGMLKGHRNAPGFEAIGVALSPDGTTLATTSLDQTVRIWAVPKFRGEEPERPEPTGRIDEADFAGRGAE